MLVVARITNKPRHGVTTRGIELVDRGIERYSGWQRWLAQAISQRTGDQRGNDNDEANSHRFSEIKPSNNNTDRFIFDRS